MHHDKLVLRRMGLADLTWVVDQHLHHFPDNVIGRLGPAMLTCYYRTFLDSTYASAIIVEMEGRSVGYLVGVLDTARHRRLMWRFHGSSLAVAAATAFVRHPLLGFGIARRRLQIAWRARREAIASRADISTTSRPAETVAVLSHVAVTEDAQHIGVGGRLVDRFVMAARRAGSNRICVATADHADRAASLYLRRGWELQRRSRTLDGRIIRLYDLYLGDHTA